MTKAGNSQITRTITLLITIFSLTLPAMPNTAAALKISGGFSMAGIIPDFGGN